MGTTAEGLRAELEMQRDDLSRDLEAIGDRVSPHRIVERKQAAVRMRVASLRDRVVGTAGGVTDTLSRVPHQIGDAVSSNAEHAKSAAQGNPLGLGLFAFGAGLVVAALLPETEPERKLAQRVQPQLEGAAEKVAHVASDAVEELRPAVQQAVGEVKDHAADAAQGIKEQAKGS